MSEQLQFIYHLKLVRLEILTEGPTPEEANLLEKHVAYIKEKTESGVVLLAGRTQNVDESCFGIVVFRANSKEEAELIMNEDPTVAGGVMKAELYPFSVAYSRLRD